MAFTVKKNTKIAIKKEATEGTAETMAGTDFLKAKADGLELTPAKEQLDQDVLGSGLTMQKSQQGLASVTGALNMYMKANGTAGAEPEYGVLLESLMGAKRTNTAQTSDSAGENTTTEIYFADTSGFKVGDTALIKTAGAYHLSPITAVDADKITHLIPTSSAPADDVVVEAFTTYYPTDAGHPSYTVEKWVEDKVKETALGCKTKTMSVGNFTTGQNPEMNFTMEGLSFARVLSTLGVTPSYDSAETPVIIDACIYQGTTKIKANEFTLSVENGQSFITDTCEGKSGSRMTSRAVTGTINPYKQDDDISDYTNFNTNQTFSLFVKASIPTGTAGEYKDIVAFYIPKCQITEMGEGDQEGLLTNALSFKATGDEDERELFITFI